MNNKKDLNEIYTVERTFLSKVTPEDVICKIIQTIVLDSEECEQYNGIVDVAMNGGYYAQ